MFVLPYYLEDVMTGSKSRDLNLIGYASLGMLIFVIRMKVGNMNHFALSNGIRLRSQSERTIRKMLTEFC